MSAHNQDVNLDFGGLLGRTFDLFKADPVNWIILGVVGSAALGCGAWGGWQNCAKKQLAGQKPEVNDVLYPFSNISLLVPPLLAGLAMIPCGFPGFILAFLWSFATPLMVRDGLDWKDATRMSKDAVIANFVPVLLLSCISSALISVGAGAFGVGTLITTPFAMVMMYVALDSFYSGAAPHQLDYSPGAQAPMAAGAPAAMPFQAPMGHAPMGHAPMGHAPMAQAPMAQAPMAQAPMGHAPMAQAPMAQAPMGHAPMGHAPMGHAPMGQAPMGQAPMGQAPMAQAPMAQAPMAQAPMAQAPMAQAPMAQAPMAQAPMAQAPMAQAPAAPAAGTPGSSSMAPAPAPPAPSLPEPAEGVVETAQQATAGEAVAGKTMAMSAVDFEAMLKNRNNGDS